MMKSDRYLYTITVCSIRYGKILECSWVNWILIYTGAAQNCSELVDITSAWGVELLVDTSISPYCLQCLDGSGVAHNDTVWFLPDGRIATNHDSPSGVERW